MRKTLLLMAVLLSSLWVTAQTRQITGRVLDENNLPIEGASVVIKGTTTGTAADAQGNFTINAKTGDVLVISATNFGSREVRVGTGNTVNASLLRQTGVIDEVVVTALGIQRQKKDLGYATARVNTNEINQARPVNAAAALQGKVAGLNVTTLNNSVFGDVKINLRGIRSLTGNNNPMLLLDGVPAPLSNLNSINPNDIENIDLLKGASAAGVYGPDARNGVIVVTTKKGNRSGAPTVTVSHSTQWEKVAFLPKMQEQFGSGGYGEYIPYENWSWGPAFDGTQRELGHELEDGTIQMHTYSAKPDEKKKFFNTGVTMQNDVSFAARDFYISVQDANIKGVMPGDKNRRTGVRVNTGREYGNFKAQFNVNYVQTNYDVFDATQMGDYNSAQNVGLNYGLMNLIFNTPANIPITSYKDFQNDKYSTYNNYFNDYGHNPYFALYNWRQKGKLDDIMTNIELNYKAASWINFTYRAAAIIGNLNATSTSKGQEINSYGKGRGFTSIPGAVYEYSNRRSRLSSEFFATFSKSLNDFKFNVIAGHYYRQNERKASNVSAPGGLTVPNLFTLSNGLGTLSGSNFTSRDRDVAVFGSVGVSYKGWANVELTGRNEWTSRLKIGGNSFFYPGANVSVVLSDAIPTLKGSKYLSYAKVRASWVKTGNADIDPYSLESTFSANANGFPYGNLAGYSANNTAFNPNLTPEFSTTKEVGIELGFFKNRLSIDLSYYNQNNTDGFVYVPAVPSTGYTTELTNAASFVNSGFELDLKLTPIYKFKDGGIELRANASYNTSEVKSVYGDVDRINIGGYTNASNYAIVGQPAFVWMATDYVRDPQGRVIVDPATGFPSRNPNLTQFGRTMPLWIVGLSPSVNWKGLTFTVVGEYRGGHYAYHNLGAEMAWTGVSAATAKNNRERFVIPNSVYWDGSKYVPNTSYAVANVNDFFTGTNTYRGIGSNFITSAASWRVREVSLSYQVPMSLLGRQNMIKGLTLAVTARNLFLWLPKSNEYTDPDFNIASGGSQISNAVNRSYSGLSNNISGVNDATINPPSRIFGFNALVRF